MGELERDTVAWMLRVVDPGWQLRSMTPTEQGFCRVYRVTIGTDRGDTVGARESLYGPLAAVRVMNDFEHLQLPAKNADRVARTLAETRLDDLG